LLIAAADNSDPRPIWYSDWGTDNGAATNNLKRALDRVLRERGSEGYARFKSRLRLSSHDKFGAHTGEGDIGEQCRQVAPTPVNGRRCDPRAGGDLRDGQGRAFLLLEQVTDSRMNRLLHPGATATGA
jgi:hypothetical protein